MSEDSYFNNYNSYSPYDLYSSDKPDEEAAPKSQFDSSSAEQGRYYEPERPSAPFDDKKAKEITALKKDKKELVRKVQQLEVDLSDASAKLESAVNKSEASSKNEEELKNKIVSLITKMKMLQDSLVHETDSNKDMVDRLTEALRHLEQLKESNEILNKRLVTADIDVKKLSSGLETARNDVTRLRNELSKSNNLLADTKNKLAVAQSSLANAETALERTQIELDEEQAEHTATKSELLNAKTDLSHVQAEFSDTEAELTSVKTELTKALSDLTTESSRSAAAMAETNRMRSEHATAKAELARIGSELSTTQELLINARLEIEAISMELSERNYELAELNRAAEGMKAMLTENEITIGAMRDEAYAKDSHISSLTRQVSDMSMDLSRLNETVVSQNEELSERNDRIIELEVTVDDVTSEVAEKEKLIASRDVEVNELGAQIAALEARIFELDQRRQSAETSMQDAYQRVTDTNRMLRDYTDRESNKSATRVAQAYGRYYPSGYAPHPQGPGFQRTPPQGAGMPQGMQQPQPSAHYNNPQLGAAPGASPPQLQRSVTQSAGRAFGQYQAPRVNPDAMAGPQQPGELNSFQKLSQNTINEPPNPFAARDIPANTAFGATGMNMPNGPGQPPPTGNDPANPFAARNTPASAAFGATGMNTQGSPGRPNPMLRQSVYASAFTAQPANAGSTGNDPPNPFVTPDMNTPDSPGQQSSWPQQQPDFASPFSTQPTDASNTGFEHPNPFAVQGAPAGAVFVTPGMNTPDSSGQPSPWAQQQQSPWSQQSPQQQPAFASPFSAQPTNAGQTEQQQPLQFALPPEHVAEQPEQKKESEPRPNGKKPFFGSLFGS